MLQLYDTDNSGTISVSELHSAFERTIELYGASMKHTMKSRMTEEDLRQIVAAVDTDGNGELDFEEFLEVMVGGRGLLRCRNSHCDHASTTFCHTISSALHYGEVEITCCIHIVNL